jgi:TM2 domain-containing membrane protein YozV
MYRIIGKDGQQYGPASAEQLRAWIAENRANAQTLALTEGAQEWKALGTLPEFAAQLNPPPAASTTPPTIQPPLPPAAPMPLPRAANKIPAGICGILLGGLGVHKFILGYTAAGLIMLLVTVLSCGLGWWVMHVIGLIEGILYLCKPDEEFIRVYVDGRREWF